MMMKMDWQKNKDAERGRVMVQGNASERCMIADVSAAGCERERLAAYDAFAREIRTEAGRIAMRLDELRGQGKAKTVTYKQLFATRMTLKEIDRRLVERGL